MELKPRIKHLRLDADNMSQRELSRRTNINQSQLSAIESGRNMPSIKICYQIAEALNCKVDDLYEVVK